MKTQKKGMMFANGVAVLALGLASFAHAANNTTNVKPDNSAVNVRDRSEAAVTAEQQGSSDADVETTRAIREQLVANDTLSTYAKNIKVITQNGKVTLKGPVENTQEKAAAEKIAKSVAGAKSVTNQLSITK